MWWSINKQHKQTAEIPEDFNQIISEWREEDGAPGHLRLGTMNPDEGAVPWGWRRGEGGLLGLSGISGGCKGHQGDASVFQVLCDHKSLRPLWGRAKEVVIWSPCKPLDPCGRGNAQIFPRTCMTAIVVLWPKMKAPQSRVTTPHTVRMTLETSRYKWIRQMITLHYTWSKRCKHLSDRSVLVWEHKRATMWR